MLETGCSDTIGKWIRTVAKVAGTSAAVTLLNSCGSGAVSSSSAPDVPFQLSPSTVTLYSGVPTTFVLSGGGLRGPYQLTSSNALVLPVPSAAIQEPQFTLTPQTVLADSSVTITARDQSGKTASSTATVTPNFVNSNITVQGTGPSGSSLEFCRDTGVICAGQPGTVEVTITQNGAPARGRSVRFDAAQGAYRFPVDAAQTQFASSITVTSDEAGKAVAVIRADVGAPFQIATIRATDVLTGAFRTATFFIRQATVAGAEFSTVPAGWVSSGTFKNQCPGGAVDFLIFGGTPPYTIRSSSPSVPVFPAFPATTPVENPSRFSATFASAACGTEGYVVIFTVTDAAGLTILPTLTVKPGTEDPPTPPPTLTLSSNSVTLGCGQQAQVLVTINNGGTTPPPITLAIEASLIPANALTATVANNVITITRASPGTVSLPARVIVGAGSAPQVSINLTLPSTVQGVCP